MKTVVKIRCLLLTVVAVVLFCIPTATIPDENDYAAAIHLSLEQSGRRTAEFSGEPIVALAEMEMDTPFTVLAWSMGQAQLEVADSVYHKSSKLYTVNLVWKRYPRFKDTTDNFFWDTIYINIGGGLKKSNMVMVKVTNLPVLFDSIRIGTILFLGQDTGWRCSIPDTVNEQKIVVYPRDLDGKIPELLITGNKGTIVRKDPAAFSLTYQPLQSSYIDTIHLKAYDQQGGKAFKTLVLSRSVPNSKPSIDSLLVQNNMLRGTWRISFVSFDTLNLSLYAHDSFGTISRVVWGPSTSNKIVIDSTNKFRARYICSTKACKDSTVDTSFRVELIDVKVFDDRGDSALIRLDLYKGISNQAPEIEKLLLGVLPVSLEDSVSRVNVTGGTKQIITLKVTDLEKKKCTVSWAVVPASRLDQKTDSSARYSAPRTLTTDTITLAVSDGVMVTKRLLLLTVDDLSPQFDSLVVGDTVFKGSDTVFYMLAVPRDTLLLIAAVRDLDAADTMKISWSSQFNSRIIAQLKDRARYVLPDSALNDTIVMKVQDGAAQIVRRLVLSPANSAPVLDSITRSGKIFKGVVALFTDTLSGSDTISYTVSAHDPDLDKLTYRWRAADSLRISGATTRVVSYRALDTTYYDTLSCWVEDERGASVFKKIIILIKKIVP